MSLENKIVLFTGGGDGIGEACASMLGSRGARVVVSDIRSDAGEAVAHEIEKAGGRAAFRRADATKEDDVKNLIDWTVATFGGLDCAHNNVGEGTQGLSLIDTQEDEWDRTMNLTLKSCWLAMKYEIPVMLRNGRGAIVNTASMAGFRYVSISSPAYSAAKAGVIHLTRWASHAYAGQGVRVNSVSPGLVVTRAAAEALTEDQQIEIARGDQLIERGTRPDEVAASVCHLLSDAAAMISGIDLPICGGAR